MTSTGDKSELVPPDGPRQGQSSSLSSDGSDVLETAPLQRNGGPRATGGQLSPTVESTPPALKQKRWFSGLTVIILCTFLFCVSVTVALIIQIYYGEPQVIPHGAVASDVDVCSEAGVNILNKGGSAVDGAISSLLCVGVVNPQSSGLGGGGFMLIHNHKKMSSKYIDFRSTAPDDVTNIPIGQDQGDEVSAKLVAVPGELLAMKHAHKLFGKLDWQQLFQPAISIAENGFNLTRHTDISLRDRSGYDALNKATTMKNIYNKNGQWLTTGDWLTRPDLARTLRKLAAEGTEAFYNGDIGKDFVETVKKYGGTMKMSDLEGYDVRVGEPIKMSYSYPSTNSTEEVTLEAVPPPSGGVIVQHILGILQQFNLTEADYNQPETLNTIIEAMKYGYAAQKLSLSYDYQSNTDAMDAAVKYLLSSRKTEQIADKIMAVNRSMSKQLQAYQATYRSFLKKGNSVSPTSSSGGGGGGSGVGSGVGREMMGTSHLSVVDNDELFVSVTSSVNSWFGSRLIASSGILLNDDLADFSPSGSNDNNEIEGGKRPRSSMSPIIAFSESRPCHRRMAVGGEGGTRIISGVANVLVNFLNFNLSLPDSVNNPRLGTHWSGQTGGEKALVSYDSEFPIAPLKSLADKFKQIMYKTPGASQSGFPLQEINSVAKDDGAVLGQSDWRKNRIKGINNAKQY